MQLTFACASNKSELLFTHPQYNTWIELMYDQNEKDILTYARAIIDNGFPPGVLMIDDNWQEDYGTFEFSARRFQNPQGMMAELHRMGFKVMLWVCPFVSADSADFRYLADQDLLHLDPQKAQDILWANTSNKAAFIRWWNGASACLDVSNPNAMKWFQGRLDYLVKDEERVVRSAQVHALMPMMQFSVAPWRILSKEHNKICLNTAKLHLEMGPKILALAKESSKTGEPIAKPMAMAFPDGGYEMIKDQFVLGSDIIVAPVVEKGARSRTVVLPKGEWQADDGSIHTGGASVQIEVPLLRLPYFSKKSQK